MSSTDAAAVASATCGPYMCYLPCCCLLFSSSCLLDVVFVNACSSTWSFTVLCKVVIGLSIQPSHGNIKSTRVTEADANSSHNV